MRRRATLQALASVAGAAACKPRPPAPDWESATMVTPASDVCALTVDDTGVYFAQGGHLKADNTLRVAPLAGGASRVLARGGSNLFAGCIALDATHAYITAPHGEGAVFRVPKTGGDLERISHAPGVRDITVDDRAVYVFGPGQLSRVPKGGGEPQVLAAYKERRHPGVFSMTKTDLLWGYHDGISRVPKVGGPMTLQVSAPPRGNPQALVTDEGNLYFSANPSHELYRSPLSGGALVLIAKKVNCMHPLRAYGEHVYFIGEPHFNDGVMRVPRSGGEPVVMGEGSTPHTFAVHSSGVYVATWSAIVRLAT